MRRREFAARSIAAFAAASTQNRSLQSTRLPVPPAKVTRRPNVISPPVYLQTSFDRADVLREWATLTDMVDRFGRNSAPSLESERRLRHIVQYADCTIFEGNIRVVALPTAGVVLIVLPSGEEVEVGSGSDRGPTTIIEVRTGQTVAV